MFLRTRSSVSAYSPFRRRGRINIRSLSKEYDDLSGQTSGQSALSFMQSDISGKVEKTPLLKESETIREDKDEVLLDEEIERAIFATTDYPDREKEIADHITLLQMARIFCKHALPAICTDVLGQLTIFSSTIFAANMNDPVMLAIVGLSNAYLSIMILAPILGLNTAQDTLTSQAFGRGDLHLCGIYLSRGRLILITFFLTLGVGPALFSQKIFLAIGQDPEVSR